MNRSEAAKILTKASAFDGRDPNSEPAATAWAEALADVPADADTYAAVSRFYSDSTSTDPGGRRWLEPHHLRTVRRQIRAQRLGAPSDYLDAGDPDETPEQFLARKRETARAIGDGRLTAPPTVASLPRARGGGDLSEEDIRALRHQKDLLRLMRETGHQGRAEDEARKHLVLRYADLAERLVTTRVVAQPEQWNGRIPPERLPSGAMNHSAYRKALVAIVAEAERRAATRAA